jgi:hypothetical protein
LQVQEAVARYLEQQRSRVRDRLVAARKERGAWDGQGSGPLPYGYCRVWDSEEHGRRGRIAVDEAAALVVRRIFALRGEGMSVRAMVQHLLTMGIRTSRGSTFGASGVQQILAHEELYRTGVRHYAGVEAMVQWPIILA